jgi:hypothetical protein
MVAIDSRQATASLAGRNVLDVDCGDLGDDGPTVLVITPMNVTGRLHAGAW